MNRLSRPDLASPEWSRAIIARYRIADRMCSVAGAHFYQAQREDGSRVVLKLPDADSIRLFRLSRFQHEYQLLQSLDIAGIIKPIALDGEPARPVMVLRHFEGEPLDRHLQFHRMELPDCLCLGIQMARMLAGLHAAGLVHRDLRPANFLFDQKRLALILLDLSLAADPHGAAGMPPGDWAYMSPEQTGRMNRPVDHRTDLYSLGVILYLLLTGCLPFAAADPLGWTHCHVARVPDAPCEIVPALPQPVSGIVMKLLAKLPEDRYQSMPGLLADLEHCLAQWQAHGRIDSFALAQQDFSEQFHIPRKLYGRQQEVDTLRMAFGRVATSGQPAVLTVSGYSGIGKSVLVNELQQPIVHEHGYFISGKFDQYRHDIPYATLTQAFGELMRQLLAESDDRIDAWRRAIQEAVGPLGQLVIDILPRLELLIGSQPAVPELPPAETQHRFRRVFRQFVGVFAQHQHPLVLFLDDLQWIDAGSLQLIEFLLTHADTRHLLLIVAWRDNEATATHPLHAGIASIRSAGVPVQEIFLTPLPSAPLNQLVADTLQAPAVQCEPLTRLIHARSEGNPFFFTQLLALLQREGLLWCEPRERRWCWDLPRIKRLDLADNVVDLMLRKLRRLPGVTRRALRLAACLGGSFTLERLALVCRTGTAELEAQLAPAATDGLVVLDAGSGKFLHDRIRQAAYSMIPPHRRAALHLGIARLLARLAEQDDSSGHLFDLANQFNRGAGLLRERGEMDRVAALNLRAARKAKASTAYASASAYLAAGMALLDDAAWQRCYRLAFDLWLERAQCDFLTGQFDHAMELLTALLQRQLPRLDMTAACYLKIMLHVARSENAQSLVTALDCLRRFGIDMPMHPTRKQIEDEFEQLTQNMQGRSIESLADLPLAADPDMQAVMRMLAALELPAAFSDMNLVFLLYCRMVNLSLRHGIIAESAHCCAGLEAALASQFHRYEDAYRFARMACVMLEKNGFVTVKARVYLYTGLAAVWTQPVSTSLEFLETSFRAALDNDDLAFACYSAMCQIYYHVVAGTSLDKMRQTTEAKSEFARQARFRDVENIIVSHTRFAMAMQGQTTTLASFSDAGFDEDAFASQLAQGGMPQVVCWHWLLKLQAAYLAGNPEDALAAAAKAEPWLASTVAEIQMLSYHYFKALAIAAATDEQAAPMPPADQHMQPAWRAQLQSHVEPLREWAQINPGTFLDKYALVAAEIARLEGRDLEAMHLYEQAIASARDNGFVHHEGIAYECASAFYRARGFAVIADTYLHRARDCYMRWGADGKAARLDALCPSMHEPAARTHRLTGREESVQLDVMAVTRASQAISGTIMLDELLDTLMRIVLQNAGARNASLLLAREGGLRLAAQASVEQQEVQVRLHLAPGSEEHARALPASILNFVRRSRERILLTDAGQPHSFSADEYFALHHPRSLLCLPIVRQAALVGVLYLENSLVTDAFTPDRVNVLELMASQAAISLENAFLYNDLRRENSERKHAEEALRLAHDELELRVRDRTAALNDSNRQLQAEILERRKANAELAEALASLRDMQHELVRAEKMAALGSLVAGVAHELNTPIGNSVTVASTLMEETEAVLADERAGKLRRSTFEQYLKNASAGTELLLRTLRRAAELVSSFKQVAVDQSSDQRRQFDLHDVLQEMAVTLAPAYKNTPYKLELELASGIRMDSYPGPLGQVITNFITNSLVHGFEGRSSGTMRIATRMPDEEHVEIIYSDDGIGIPPENQPRVFDPFFTTKLGQGGSGLGMNIVYNLVTNVLGGTIGLRSTVGEGMTLIVALPLRAPGRAGA